MKHTYKDKNVLNNANKKKIDFEILLHIKKQKHKKTQKIFFLQVIHIPYKKRFARLSIALLKCLEKL